MLWQHKTGATSLCCDKTGLPQIGLWSGSKLVGWGEGEIPVRGAWDKYWTTCVICFSSTFFKTNMFFSTFFRRNQFSSTRFKRNILFSYVLHAFLHWLHWLHGFCMFWGDLGNDILR